MVIVSSPFHFQIFLDSQSAVPQKRIAQFAKENGLEHIDVLEILKDHFSQIVRKQYPQLQNFSDDEVVYFVRHKMPSVLKSFWFRYFIDEDHYSIEGHEYIAEILYRKIKSSQSPEFEN